MSEITAEMIERGRGADPRRAAERRKSGARIQRARERSAASDAVQAGHDRELLRIYATARLDSALSATTLIALVGLCSFWWARSNLPILWGAAAFASLLICCWAAKSFTEVEDLKLNPGRWTARLALAECVHSAIWGGVALVVGSCDDPKAQIFTIGMLLLVSAFNCVVTAAAPLAAYAASIPIICATFWIIGFHSLGDHSTATLALVFLCAAQLFFLLLARRFHQLSFESVSHRCEKSELIAELEQAKAKSDEARRRAEEANLAKSRFLATMSHELRTPLNAILGFSEVLKNEIFGAHSNPSYKDYANDIHSSGQHLLTLINEILDISRIEAGRYDLKEESLSLGAIAQDCRHLLALRAQKGDLELEELIEPNLPRIWADERAMRQIVLNLLANAIKFTPRGGLVTIKVGWTSAGGQYLSVKDNGPGIPENEIAVVLSSFGRGSLAHKHAEEGAGLGLPIVKGLIELHNGRFLLRSKLREGTEAIMALPPQRVMDALPHIETDAKPMARQSFVATSP
ncbi:sensor histidine kinase [Methylocystis bryophila]|uniref:histidine kinase n=1 Tax=Methylocystis bryophila TaxID=655015 RepID=A0A1W6N0Z3_9HYPH|nr:HAMP domain-containing sensor histidine kinase [Methylocystis bryophila]ARN83520.1 two-component sensor histidine kinase [Methylocystis bryophila]BDV37229.1 two-component sensor histidine kinase [Methylocystis bryophila]